MNEDHKPNGLKPIITSTPYGKSIGGMWEMLNSVISPISNLTHNVNEKKLLPRPVQRNSVFKPSDQHTGKNVLNNTNYLAEYRSSIKHSGIQSQFARLEVIESDDDSDEEVTPQITKVTNKHVIRSLKEKKITESHIPIHDKGEYKVGESDRELASKRVEAENKVIDENDRGRGKRERKAEVNVLRPKRLSTKEQNVFKKEGTEIKKSAVSLVRCKPVNKKISLQPTKQTFKKEKPSVEVVDVLESKQSRLCKCKPELNSLISNNSSVSQSIQLIHQKDEPSIAVTDTPETGECRLHKHKPELNSLISNDSTVLKSDQLICEKDEPSVEIIETLERGQHNLRKRKYEVNNSKRSRELRVSKSNKLTVQKDVCESGDKEKDISLATVSETCRQKYKTRKKIDSSESNKTLHKEDKPSVEIIETLERGQHNLRKRKYEVNNSKRSRELRVSKSNKLTVQKDICESGEKEKDISLTTVSETCRQKYRTRKKIDSSESNKTHHKEECIYTFEEAVFHKHEGVAMATCVSVPNFTAGYVEIDRQRLFLSKTTNLVFHVLEGEPEVTINKITKCVKPGTFVYIPPGSCYHIKNSYSERVRLSYTKVVT